MDTSPTTPESAKPLMGSVSPANASCKTGSEDVRFDFETKPSKLRKDADTLCGVLAFRPAWLQRCADIRVFTMVLSIMSLLNGVVFAYFNAVITSIENRFGLSSSTMGFVKNSDNIGYLLSIVIVSHFCRYSNKPRLFAAATVLSAFATCLFAFPHFLYGAGDDLNSDESQLNHSAQPLFHRGQLTHFCDSQNVEDPTCAGDTKALLGKFNAGALAFFLASEILQGVSNSPAVSLSITYMDDNAEANSSPKYFGWMFATRALSPLIGYGLGAWATSVYVDFSDTDLSTRDPRWVGAWWIGFVIISVVMLFWSIPVLLFPPRLPGNNAGQDEETDLKAMAKDLPKAVMRLLRNPLYICLVAGMCFDMYLMGFFTFLPKYIEKHFMKSPSMASIVAGAISAFGWALGPILGGRLLVGQCQTPRGSMRVVVIISLTTAIGFLILMFLSCTSLDFAGDLTVKSFNPDLKCNGNCSCDRSIFEPVCGPEENNYFSACYAGCPLQQPHNTSKLTDLKDCSCATNREIVTSGFCDKECATFIPYGIILFLAALVNGMYIIPAIMSIMRCVDYKDKAISLAISTGIMQIISFPAPMLFGFAIDRACLVEDNRCGEEGRCLLYDDTKFRYRLHGLTMIIKVLGTICYTIGWYFSCKSQYNEYKSDADQKKGTAQNNGT